MSKRPVMARLQPTKIQPHTFSVRHDLMTVTIGAADRELCGVLAATDPLATQYTANAPVEDRMIGRWPFASHDHTHHRIDEVRRAAFARVIRLAALTAVWTTGIAH
jgi:hypothetical protein